MADLATTADLTKKLALIKEANEAAEAAGKDASEAAATLREGRFEEVKLRGADGLIGARAGQSAGFYVKLTDLTADLSRFKIYFTSVARANATCRTDACAALPAGGAGEDQLEKYIADNLPSWIAADFAPLEAHIIDEDTYVEQAVDLQGRYGDAFGHLHRVFDPAVAAVIARPRVAASSMP